VSLRDRLVNARQAIGSAVGGRRVGYGRSGRARMEGARKPITSGPKEVGAGRTTLPKRPTAKTLHMREPFRKRDPSGPAADRRAYGDGALGSVGDWLSSSAEGLTLGMHGARRANHFVKTEFVSSPTGKNIPLPFFRNK
jgi:hypothetical protein